MGLFSWECKACGLPILVPHATNKVNRWMNQAVAVDRNGKFYNGSYEPTNEEMDMFFGLLLGGNNPSSINRPDGTEWVPMAMTVLPTANDSIKVHWREHEQK